MTYELKKFKELEDEFSKADENVEEFNKWKYKKDTDGDYAMFLRSKQMESLLK